jgi:dTDP-glucose 4,6-dehydratase
LRNIVLKVIKRGDVLKLLITGGAGFIGSNFLHKVLSDEGSVISASEVRVLDKLTYSGTRANFDGLDLNSFRFIRGDICDPSVTSEATRDIDLVVHFAAESHVDRSISLPYAFIETNVKGTGVLLESCLKNEVKTFVHVSTDEVYGSRDLGSFSESDLLNPSSPYSSSKAGSDLLALSFHKTYDMDIRVTRSSNNYGPRQYPEKIIPLFITNLLQGKKLPLYGKGSNVRDWLHVEDHCRALELVITRGRSGEIYNVGGGNELTNYDLAMKLLSEFGLDDNWIEFVRDRLGHDFRYSIDFSKLKTLGFIPKVEFNVGLTSTINWFRDNINWWNSISAHTRLH